MARSGDSDSRVHSVGDWFTLHVREVVVGVVVVLVAVAGVFFYRQVTAANRRSAEQQFFAAQAQAADPAAQQKALDQVISNFEGTPSAAQAAMLLAQLRYDEGKYDEGLAALRRLQQGGVSDEFAASVDALIAAGLEGKGSFGEAAARYLAAAEKARFDADRQSYLADAARAYRLAGNEAEAVKLWTQLASDPANPHSAEARVRLGELTAAAATRG
ncbi:MAG TPA: tetratricopeptide repeat protein [Gemmatimonadaceae bacterium]|nr:tetratricopeptide repeat protein [Gemmatimonadaceae bacterium]